MFKIAFTCKKRTDGIVRVIKSVAQKKWEEKE
jgi:hypothetical protein